MADDIERTRQLSGIINSKPQLVEAAAELARAQIAAAQMVLGEDPAEETSALAVEVAKLISSNMWAHDLITVK